MKTFSASDDFWFGDVSDAADRFSAATSLAALVAKVHGVRAFPVSAANLLQLANDPKFDVKATAKTIEADPAMAARVLRLVNSAAYALVHPCKSVRQAVVLLGAKRIAEVAAAAAVVDLFDDESLQSATILKHGAAVANVARYLASVARVSPEDMFTCGLLHDVGKLMLLQVGEDAYAGLLERVGSAPDELHSMERTLYGFDHAVLAGAMLSDWKIPDPIPKVVGWHHNPARAYKEGQNLAAMVHLLRFADRAAPKLLEFESADLSAVDELARSEAATYLGISGFLIEREWSALRRGCVQENRATDDPASDRPSSQSRRATSSRPGSAPTIDEAPAEVAVCVICREETFGDTCRRCNGALCPDHDQRRRPWCLKCEREYEKRAQDGPIDLPLRVATWSLAAIAVGLEAYGAGAEDAPVQSFSLVALTLCGAALSALGYRRWMARKSFVTNTPERGDAR